MAQGGRLDKALAPCDDLRMNPQRITRLIRRYDPRIPIRMLIDVRIMSGDRDDPHLTDADLDDLGEIIGSHFGYGTRRAARWERRLRSDAAQWNADLEG